MPSIYIVLVAECDLLGRFIKFLSNKNVLLPDRGRGGGQPELYLVLGRAGPSLGLPASLPLPLHLDGTEVLKEGPGRRDGRLRDTRLA